jgi:hypothetical protein
MTITRRHWLGSAAALAAAPTAFGASLLQQAHGARVAAEFGLRANTTVDQSQALLAAIGGMQEGETLVLAPGAYRLDEPVVVKRRRNITLRGPGASFTAPHTKGQVIPAFGSAVMVFEECSGVILDSLTWDMRGAPCGAVCLVRCDTTTMRRCEVFGSGGSYQIASFGGRGNSYVDNYIHDSAANSRGMWIGNLSPAAMEMDVTIRGNRATSNGATGIGCHAIRGEVTGNLCNGNNGSGVVVSAGNGLSTTDVRCTRNICLGNAFHGIQSDCVYKGPRDVTMRIHVGHNDCSGNGGSGIYALHTSSWTIVRNRCYDNAQRANGDGITIGRSEAVTVTENTCGNSPNLKSQRSGIRVVGEASFDVKHVLISGNVLNGNRESGITVANVKDERLTAITVANNVSTDNAVGIEIIDSAGDGRVEAKVTGNRGERASKTDFLVRRARVFAEGNAFSSGR